MRKHPLATGSSEKIMFLIPALGLLLIGQVTFAAQVPTPDSEAMEHLRAGLQAFQQGQMDKAARDLQAAIRLAPDLAEAYLNLGLVRNRQGNFEKAIEVFKKVLQL